MNNVVQYQTPSFTSIAKSRVIPKSKKSITNMIGNMLERTSEYSVAENKKLDVYFLKPKARDVVRVVYFDRDMCSFVRNGSDKILETTARCPRNIADASTLNISDRICKVLSDITRGKYKAPNWYYNPGELIDQYNRIIKVNRIEP